MIPNEKYVFFLSNVSKTMLLGSKLASVCDKSCIIYLNGCIGTGKSIFCQGFLRKFGYVGYVTSPTYSLIKSYCVGDWNVYHLDCYRLSSLEELEYLIGIRDFLHGKFVCLIEWPKSLIGSTLLTEDILVTIYYNDGSFYSRTVVIESISSVGQEMLNALSKRWK